MNLTFNGIEYPILAEFMRTKGSKQQELIPVGQDTDREIETRRRFYVIDHPSGKKWIKVYAGNLGMSCKSEYEATRAVKRPWTCIEGLGMCRAVVAYGYDPELEGIMFEFVEGTKPTILSQEQKILLREWIKEHNIIHYDLNYNNIIIKSDKEMILIDFEVSVDRNVRKDFGVC